MLVPNSCFLCCLASQQAVNIWLLTDNSAKGSKHNTTTGSAAADRKHVAFSVLMRHCFVSDRGAVGGRCGRRSAPSRLCHCRVVDWHELASPEEEKCGQTPFARCLGAAADSLERRARTDSSRLRCPRSHAFLATSGLPPITDHSRKQSSKVCAVHGERQSGPEICSARHVQWIHASLHGRSPWPIGSEKRFASMDGPDAVVWRFIALDGDADWCSP